MMPPHDASLWGSLRPWLVLLGQRRDRLFLGALLMGLTLLSAIGLLALSGWFITATGLAGLLLAAGMAASLDVYVPGGGIRFFAVTRTVSRYVERLYNHDTVLRLLADLRSRLFAVLSGLDAHALSRRRASDWLNRLTADIDTLDSLYLRLLAPALVALLVILGLAVFLALWAPRVGVATGALLLLGWLWLTLGQARLGMTASRRQVGDLEQLRGRLIEQLQGLAELEAYGSLADHRVRLAAIEARLYRDQRRLGQRVALGNALASLVVGLAMLLALWLAAEAWSAGILSGPLTVMMPLAVLAISEALAPLPVAFTWLGATWGAAERLNALEAQQEEVATPLASVQLPAGALSVTLENVTLTHADALVPALAEISFDVAPGQRLALCGVSGAGKSSVAGLLTRQLKPEAGEVRLAGVALGAWPASALTTRVALLTQQTDLFDDTLAANLRLADPEASDARLWRALGMMELADWARALPQGLDTRVGEGGRRLSGGQARRLALARLLLREPDLVLLDEPFAGLDAETATRIATRLDEWLAGRTVIYLVHQLGDTVDPPGIDRCLTLRSGRLCTNGQDVSG
ncbi:thiol reductant ABC exporter subunit CydC [Halomonas lysinitropha]|uniref:Multidrug export ATP-binding/permease protein n=1 Tax=Halomonas lysinitropha TaxID=2607506 RepID=A0A5K1I9V0_9GAMM|nr:thiol reductant ABC exporter subunit CydC [Halomonas lysinitropha]VVZ97187.1 Putative multidrug export ATP-binding/permease protein [Halomonas lysinitropha]